MLHPLFSLNPRSALLSELNVLSYFYLIGNIEQQRLLNPIHEQRKALFFKCVVENIQMNYEQCWLPLLVTSTEEGSVPDFLLLFRLISLRWFFLNLISKNVTPL